MRPSAIVVIAVVVVIFFILGAIVFSAPGLVGTSKLGSASQTSSTTASSPATVTVNDTITQTISTTLPTSVTTTATPSSVASTTTLFVTKNYTSTNTSTTTVYTALSARPRLVKSNGYFLTTPIDLVQWSQPDFLTLVQNLVESNITYLYFNLPNINNDGSLQDNFTMDAQLILRFHETVRGIAKQDSFQYIGWTGTQQNPDAVLGNYTSSAIDETVRALYKAGFDGLLIDLEPIPNDSPQFLGMLRDFRSAINQFGPYMMLGANSMVVSPGAEPGHEWAWDPGYFENVTSLLDFTSPMLFESGASTLSEYVNYVSFQIQMTSQYSRCPIMFAIPDWYANTTWHHPYGENLTNAIIAFRAYLDQGESPQPTKMLGLGIYGLNKTYILTPGTVTEALETTPQDWSYFINQWVNTGYPQKIGSGVG